MESAANGAIAATRPTLLSEFADRDLIQELLADKKSPATRRAYAGDLKHFFQTIASADPNPALIREFLGLDRFAATSLVLKYKSLLGDKSLAEATVNRRLAAIKSLVDYARKVGKCEWSLADVRGDKVKPYRDTTGVDVAALRRMLGIPKRETLAGKRDYALLRLLWENALRRGEVSRANLSDFEPESRKLRIFGKGRGQQAETISLSVRAVEALQEWLAAYGTSNPEAPLFCALDRVSCGHRLSTTSIYRIVRAIATEAGIKKIMSPHRIRHSAITAALDSTQGDVRRVQRLSRHAKLDTLIVYDDNRQDLQGDVSQVLSDLV